MEEVRRVAKSLGEQGRLAHGDRQLAALGHVEHTVDTDEIADVQLSDALERLLTERVEARVGLDRPAHIADIQKEGLAVPALADHAAGDPILVVGVLALLEGSGSWAASISSILTRPGKARGKGSIPCSRSRSALARRSASVEPGARSSGLTELARASLAARGGRDGACSLRAHGTRPEVTRSPPM